MSNIVKYLNLIKEGKTMLVRTENGLEEPKTGLTGTIVDLKAEIFNELFGEYPLSAQNGKLFNLLKELDVDVKKRGGGRRKKSQVEEPQYH
ncbi:hypothetical protein RCC89_13890 [Cytophagaceae bacterium ABcell3]|nr:hypothetical protein RCC89_13890 [Cytophagaceae bacterium ABcell3]